MLTLKHFIKIKENKWDIAYWELIEPIIDNNDVYTATITSLSFEKQFKFNIDIEKNDILIKTIRVWYLAEAPEKTYLEIQQLIKQNNND